MIKVCLNIPLKKLDLTLLLSCFGMSALESHQCVFVLYMGSGNCTMIMMWMNFHLKNLTLPCSVWLFQALQNHIALY